MDTIAEEERFRLTSELLEDLTLWKYQLNNRDDTKKWIVDENQAEKDIQELFKEKEFKEGGNLAAEDFDKLFRRMKKFSSNRAISNLLYRNIGIEEFNRAIRVLYFGHTEFADRINDFFKIKGIGLQTLSQFLLALDLTKYPLITNPTKEVLNLDSFQEDLARKIALTHFNINNASDFLPRTIEYLTYFIVFETVKNKLELTKYTEVNNVLYIGRLSQDEDVKPEDIISEPPYISVSLEKDLRDYLALNPSSIEEGLTLIQKEFDTKEVGRIDLLCKDKNGRFVVIELKKGRINDSVVGQILRYIGWVQQTHDTVDVRGIIIVGEADERLEYAVIPLKQLIELKYYRVNFEISPTYFS